MANWQDAFGGANVAPAQATFEAIELSEDTALVWPLESSGSPTVATVMYVTPTAADLELAMPDATQGATGVASLIVYNPGNVAFTLTDTFDAQIAVIGVGEAWTITLTDNGTPAGAWSAIQLGAGSSNAQAGQLAGYGLQALMTALQLSISTVYLNTNTLIDLTYRAKGVVWDSGDTGTLQLDAIATLTAGWFVLVSNLGTQPLTISTSGGDTINAVATITLPPGGSGSPYSVMIVAASDGFNTFAGTPPIIPIDGGGTGADNADQALVNLGGSAIGIDIFEAPNAAAILALLGIGSSAFTEYTIASDQNLTASSINSAFVATQALTLNLPDSTASDITSQFLFAAYAYGGAVTLSPVGGDKINNGTTGVSFVVPKGGSLILVTDADGNWWPLFLYTPNGIPWAIATGTGDAMVAAYTPSIPALADGVLIGVRAIGANTIAAPTINVDGLGLRAITKDGGSPLVPNDIPGATAEILLRYSAAHTSWEMYNPTINLDLIGSTQGDILYRDADGWAALAPGAAGQVLGTGGAAANPSWGDNTGRLLSVTEYLAVASGTYTAPAGTTLLVVDVVAGGGGGAGTTVTGSGNKNAGSGGGAGAYTRGVYTPAANIAWTVGGGGAGGTAGADGATGSNSNFGTLVVNGGNGGKQGTASTSADKVLYAQPVAGGVVSAGGTIISSHGAPGCPGVCSNAEFCAGGNGAPGPFGGGGLGGFSLAASASANGDSAASPGAGGGGAGASSSGSATTANGGNGSAGSIIIYAFS